MSLMYAQFGMAALGAVNNYDEARSDSKLREIQQRYSKAMSAIALSQELNAQTLNEIGVRDSAAMASFSIEQQSLKDRASASVSAAAAGVGGASVRSAMNGLMRSKLLAKDALRRKVQDNATANKYQRRNLAISSIMGRDVSVIGRPSVASSLLGLGAAAIDIFDKNQPEGSRIADTLAGWGRS